MFNNNEYDEEANRRRVLEGRAVLERTADSLARSHQVALETEQIGTEVISELEEQRESLLRTQRRLQETNEGLSQTRRILSKMYRNTIANKALLILIIILEVAILVASIVKKFI